MSKDKTPEPMDPGAQETAAPTTTVHNPRVCYAAQTLAAEVEALFPETPVEYSNPNGRNVSLDVGFDLSMLDASDTYNLIALLQFCKDDVRVADVIADTSSDAAQVLVSFRNSALTQDSRVSFGLEDAWIVMAEGMEEQPMVGMRVPAMVVEHDTAGDKAGESL